MELKDLLKKAQSKLDQSKPTNIRQASIALEDRPYDEFVEQNREAEKGKKSQKIQELKKEPLKVLPKTEVVEAISEISLDVVKSENKLLKQKAISTVNQDFFQENFSILYLKLAGVEKKIVDCFFEFTKINNSMSIGPISSEQICSMLSIKLFTFKKTIAKIKAKNILLSTYSKTGKGGWVIYEFNTKFYQELVSGERIKWSLKEDLLENRAALTSQPIALFSKQIPKNLLPEGWDSLDFEDLAEKGFTKNHLIQIYQDQEKIGKIFDASALQYSLDAFRYDLEHNESTLIQKSHSKSPVTFFTQILSKGRPYNSFTPEKFKTPQELEFQKYREKSEKVKKDFEELKSKFFESEYQNWYQGLSDSDLDEILKLRESNFENMPISVQKKLKAKAIQEYYEQYVWLDIQKELHKKFFS